MENNQKKQAKVTDAICKGSKNPLSNIVNVFKESGDHKIPKTTKDRPWNLRSHILVPEKKTVKVKIPNPVVQKPKETNDKLPLPIKDSKNSNDSQNVEDAINMTILPQGVSEIDKDCIDPFQCSGYASEIYKYLRELEDSLPIANNFLQDQKHVTSAMRCKLIDWLIQVHWHFHLRQEVLYLTISVIDRYLQAQIVTARNFQLVGVVSLMIAAKYEEVHDFPLCDLVYITDNSYTTKDIIKMETKILSALHFRIGRPDALQFLRRLTKASKCCIKVHTTTKYLIEVTLTESQFAAMKPSLVAAASFFLAQSVINEESFSWSSQLQFYSGYAQTDLEAALRALLHLLISIDNSMSAKIKYSDNAFFNVSDLPELAATRLIALRDALF